MARIGRSLLLALAAGAAGGVAATLLNRNDGQKRTLAKSAVRSGLLMYDRLRGAMGEMSENLSDVVAEVQSEIETERTGAKPHPGGDAHKHEAREHVVPFGAKPDGERHAHG